MKINITKLPQSEIEIKIEVPSEEFQEFYEKAVLELGGNVEIAGFRKGHAPKEAIEKEVGYQKILETAAEECLRESYIKAIRENKIEPLSRAETEILKLAPGNPFEFRARVAILPEIKLPDYKKIVSRIKKKRVELTAAEIDRLKAEKERLEKERQRGEILEKIAQETEMEIPQLLIAAEQNRMLENLKQQISQMLQISFEDYLKRINKTEKEVLDSLASEAKKRVKNILILKKIEKEENIESSDEEIRAESEKILSKHPNVSQLDRERLKEYTKEVIKNEKTFQMLENLTQAS